MTLIDHKITRLTHIALKLLHDNSPSSLCLSSSAKSISPQSHPASVTTYSNMRGKNPLCLVLALTRELVRQVENNFREFSPILDTICLYGGTPIGQQVRELNYGVDVAVGTPGRIIDLMKRGDFNLSKDQFVLLDEADQMLQVGIV